MTMVNMCPKRQESRWWWSLPRKHPYPLQENFTIITDDASGNEKKQKHVLYISNLDSNANMVLSNCELDKLIMGLQKARLKATQARKDKEIRESAK